MKFSPLFIISFIFITLSSHAQKNFQSALIVNNEGDSIRGFINIKDWDRNPSTFLFKEDVNASGRDLSVKDVRYFEVGEFKYFRSSVSISMDAVKYTAAVLDVAPRTDTVFLRVFQFGKNISMFSYIDNVKTRYYIMESDSDTPVELELKLKAWRDVYSRWNTKVFEGYKNQLTNLAIKYKVITSKLKWDIDHTTYGDNIVKIVSIINGLNPKKITVKARPEIHLYAGVAMNKSWMTYAHGKEYPELADNAKSNPSIVPGFTAGIDYTPKPATNKLHFNFELMISSMKNHMTSDAALPTTNVTIDYKFAFTSYNVSVLAQYNFLPHKKINFFVATGIRYTKASYSENLYTITGSSTSSSSTPDFFQLSKSWFSMPLKAGVSIGKRAQLYGCYIPTFLFNDNTLTMKENLHAYQIGINVNVF